MALGRVIQGWYRILDLQDDPVLLVYRPPLAGRVGLTVPYNDESRCCFCGIGNEDLTPLG
jgi:hypothetical protein